MALKSFVKVSAVNNLSDARYCAGMEVDLIGFSLEKDKPGYVSPENYSELTEWLSGPQYVGEFNDYSAMEIQEAVAQYNVDYIEVTNKNTIDQLGATTLPVILKQTVTEAAKLTFDLDIAFLLITSDDDSLSDDDLKLICSLSEHYNVLLGSGITDENVDSLLKRTHAKGIALQGGDELRPGYKDYDELADILEALEIDDLS